MSKNIFLFLLILLLLNQTFSQNFKPINPSNIKIVRDSWGVPHVYGKTDAEAAYGLAWVNAEDAFDDVQEMYMVTKPISGKQSIRGAKADFFTHFIQVDSLIIKEMNTLPLEYLTYLDGYAQGLNKYAETHPKEVKAKALFPLTVKEILKLPIVVMSAFTRVTSDLGKAYEGELLEQKYGLGSNAIAVNKNKTVDGKTYLLANPHMPVKGTFSFYEAHINSEEGLNIHGAIFMGGTSIFMGNNENLGWGMTWNHFDRGDIYKLEMHPTEKNTYLYDGKWEKLEVKKTKLKVKVAFFTFPIKKETYWSKLGPVIKTKKGNDYFAIKKPATSEIKSTYQWYLMNKANSYKEFKDALSLQAISMFNIVYADKESNIYYISNGKVPVRNDSLVQLSYIPGQSSANVWTKIHTLEELPHNFNPPSGFVFNTNNTPFQSTNVLDTIAKNNSPAYMDKYPGNNNRATRVLELMAQKDKIDFTYFQKIKYDVTISKNAYIVKKLAPVFDLKPSDYPEISDMIEIMQNWDFVVDSNDVGATIFMTSISELFEAKGYDNEQFIVGIDITTDEILAGITKAKEWLIKHYGTIQVPIKTVFIGKKGDRIVSPPGFPDVLSANYGVKKEDKYELIYGDTYTHFVKFNSNGVEEMRTSVPFGNSNHPEDDSYFNQAKLYERQETKPMTLDKETIFKNAARTYSPQ